MPTGSSKPVGGAQGTSCVVNAIVPYVYRGSTFSVVSGSVLRDKHPDRRKRRPRPFWGVLDGLAAPAAPLDALRSMLEGADAIRSLIRDTDSPDGDPSRASRWIAAPLPSGARSDASLHALLRMPPISMSAPEAASYHGHAAKRVLLSVAEASPAFGPIEANEFGRFSGSLAQEEALEPVQAMLERHTLRAAALPHIYARHARVARFIDSLCRLHLVQRDACAAAAVDPAVLPREGGYGSDSVFSRPSIAGAPILALSA